MTDELASPIPEETAIQALRAELVQDGGARWSRILEKFVMAAIGSIPWVGGFLAAARADVRAALEAALAGREFFMRSGRILLPGLVPE